MNNNYRKLKNINGETMILNLFIFLSKIIENTFSTLRLILVANGKKKIGAILNGIISLCWVFSTTIVIININKDVFNILSFCLGAIVGSYLGSLIEEKIALGNALLICKCNINVDKIIKSIKEHTKDVYNYENILFIHTKRKKIKKIMSLIKPYDRYAHIIGLKVKKID